VVLGLEVEADAETEANAKCNEIVQFSHKSHDTPSASSDRQQLRSQSDAISSLSVNPNSASTVVNDPEPSSSTVHRRVPPSGNKSQVKKSVQRPNE
jgi:hypothetical protein